jgi:hypothetical protein
MRSFSPILALLGVFSCASATSLTYKLPANAHECVYAHVETAGTKVSFYFAVQAGGDFDRASNLD